MHACRSTLEDPTAITLAAIAAGCRGAGLRPQAAPPGLRYTDVAAASGLDQPNQCGTLEKQLLIESLGAGACWLDYDRDGRLDLFLVQGSTLPGRPRRPPTHDLLYHGGSDGRFTEVSAAAGIVEDDWGQGCAVGDVDGDGWPDLYVTNLGANRLWINRGDGSFTDATRAAGVGDVGWGASAAFADLDGDGHLDLFVVNYVEWDWADLPRPGPRHDCTFQGATVFCGPKGLKRAQPVFYRNRGDGTFSDASAAAGFRAVPASYGLGVVPVDFDRDGRLDLYVANDSEPNRLWRNRGDGTFEEVGLRRGAALSGDGLEQASMGVDAGDYDNDGWPDLFVSNFSGESFTLYRNLGGFYSDVSQAAGLTQASLDRLGWGTRFLDLDRDGDLDLVIACGHVYPQVDALAISPSLAYRERALVFFNQAGRFVDRTAAAGPGLERARPARGLAAADYDDDGDVDLLVVDIDEPPALLRADDVPGSWIGLELAGRVSNRDGQGAVVTVVAPGLKPQRREATNAGSFLSASDPRLLFGLAGGARAGVEVRWPAGGTDHFGELAAGHYYRLTEGAGTAVPLP